MYCAHFFINDINRASIIKQNLSFRCCSILLVHSLIHYFLENCVGNLSHTNQKQKKKNKDDIQLGLDPFSSREPFFFTYPTWFLRTFHHMFIPSNEKMVLNKKTYFSEVGFGLTIHGFHPRTSAPEVKVNSMKHKV